MLHPAKLQGQSHRDSNIGMWGDFNGNSGASAFADSHSRVQSLWFAILGLGFRIYQGHKILTTTIIYDSHFHFLLHYPYITTIVQCFGLTDFRLAFPFAVCVGQVVPLPVLAHPGKTRHNISYMIPEARVLAFVLLR